MSGRFRWPLAVAPVVAFSAGAHARQAEIHAGFLAPAALGRCCAWAVAHGYTARGGRYWPAVLGK